jgi:hypothetical protein
LLTGEKAISLTRTDESKSLATYFIQSVDENNLFDIIDSQVLKEGKKEEIIEVVNLAKRCLNLNGKKRPTMKEVAMELELVQMLQKAPKLQQNYEELEYVQEEMHGSWDVVASSTISTSSVDVQPLLSSQSVWISICLMSCCRLHNLQFMFYSNSYLKKSSKNMD